MRNISIATAVLLPILAIAGCSDNSAKIKIDEANFEATIKAQQDILQWKLDDATAAHIWNDGTQAGLNNYLTFRRCHEATPKNHANQEKCASLQARVSKQEAEAKAENAKNDANW